MINDFPIFVVGRDRAAVQRLTTLITAHDRLGAVPGSALLGDLAAATERNQEGLAPYGYPQQYWLASLADLVDRLQHEHVARAGKARWVDCPPWGCPSVDLLDRLFPHAQIIQVTGGPRFRAGTSRSVARAEKSLGAGRYHQVAMADLQNDPVGCTDRVWRFLGEPRPALAPAEAEEIEPGEVRVPSPRRSLAA